MSDITPSSSSSSSVPSKVKGSIPLLKKIGMPAKGSVASDLSVPIPPIAASSSSSSSSFFVGGASHELLGYDGDDHHQGGEVNDTDDQGGMGDDDHERNEAGSEQGGGEDGDESDGDEEDGSESEGDEGSDAQDDGVGEDDIHNRPYIPYGQLDNSVITTAFGAKAGSIRGDFEIAIGAAAVHITPEFAAANKRQRTANVRIQAKLANALHCSIELSVSQEKDEIRRAGRGIALATPGVHPRCPRGVSSC